MFFSLPQHCPDSHDWATVLQALAGAAVVDGPEGIPGLTTHADTTFKIKKIVTRTFIFLTDQRAW